MTISHVGAFNFLHFYGAFFATIVATKTEKKTSAHLPVTQIIWSLLCLYVYQIKLFATEKGSEKYLMYGAVKLSTKKHEIGQISATKSNKL